MNKSRLVIATLLVLGACASGYGQGSCALVQKITDAAKVNRPGWRLETTLPTEHVEGMGCPAMGFTWVTEGRESVIALLWSYSSAEAAAAMYEKLIAMPPKPGRRRRAGSEERSGSDSYNWVEESAREESRKVDTFFRLSKKGKMVLIVVGFKPEDATGFSALIATELPAT